MTPLTTIYARLAQHVKEELPEMQELKALIELEQPAEPMNILKELNVDTSDVYPLPNLASFLTSRGLSSIKKSRANGLDDMDRFVIVEGFGSGGVCINNAHRFYDYALHISDVTGLQAKLEEIFKPYANKIAYQKWKSFLRVWIYWDVE